MREQPKDDQQRTETIALVQDLAKQSTEAVRNGPAGTGQVAQAIRSLQHKRRLSREELDRATTI